MQLRAYAPFRAHPHHLQPTDSYSHIVQDCTLDPSSAEAIEPPGQMEPSVRAATLCCSRSCKYENAVGICRGFSPVSSCGSSKRGREYINLYSSVLARRTRDRKVAGSILDRCGFFYSFSLPPSPPPPPANTHTHTCCFFLLLIFLFFISSSSSPFFFFFFLLQRFLC